MGKMNWHMKIRVYKDTAMSNTICMLCISEKLKRGSFSTILNVLRKWLQWGGGMFFLGITLIIRVTSVLRQLVLHLWVSGWEHLSYGSGLNSRKQSILDCNWRIYIHNSLRTERLPCDICLSWERNKKKPQHSHSVVGATHMIIKNTH